MLIAWQEGTNKFIVALCIQSMQQNKSGCKYGRVCRILAHGLRALLLRSKAALQVLTLWYKAGQSQLCVCFSIVVVKPEALASHANGCAVVFSTCAGVAVALDESRLIWFSFSCGTMDTPRHHDLLTPFLKSCFVCWAQHHQTFY